MKELKGVIAQQNITGAIKQQSITAAMSPIVTRPTAEVYKGPYEVTPTTEGQSLETKDKVMSSDVTIEKIPFYEVTNEAGGTTITIARKG